MRNFDGAYFSKHIPFTLLNKKETFIGAEAATVGQTKSPLADTKLQKTLPLQNSDVSFVKFSFLFKDYPRDQARNRRWLDLRSRI
jgi:hypothetical protein